MHGLIYGLAPHTSTSSCCHAPAHPQPRRDPPIHEGLDGSGLQGGARTSCHAPMRHAPHTFCSSLTVISLSTRAWMARGCRAAPASPCPSCPSSPFPQEATTPQPDERGAALAAAAPERKFGPPKTIKHVDRDSDASPGVTY